MRVALWFLLLVVATRPAFCMTWQEVAGGPNRMDASSPGPRGQQPFAVAEPVDTTPSQSNTTQLNQLFRFETTPDICAAGEWYATANFEYLKYPGTQKTYRYAAQGQYGLTDQIAVGAFVPVISAKGRGTNTGLGDIGVYAQYKFDQLINPEIINVTAQADLILPTGDRNELRDTGHFGFRPSVLAYKDFGQQGPGQLGMYGTLGFTATTNSDVRVGFAATYQYHDVVGVLEIFDQAGSEIGRPIVQITPGVVFRGIRPFEIAVGAPIGVNSGTPDWGINVKLTYAFH